MGKKMEQIFSIAKFQSRLTRFWLASGAVFIILFAVVNTVFAGPGHRMMHNKRSHLFHDMLFLKEKLDLSDAQVDKLAELNQDFQKKLLDLRQKIRPLRRQLGEYLLKADNRLDRDKVKKLLTAISQVEVEIRLMMIQHHFDIERLLTQKQRDILRKQRRRGRRQSGYQKNKGGHGNRDCCPQGQQKRHRNFGTYDRK